MAKVIVRNGNVESALRTFKQKNAREGFLQKYKEKKEGFEKPGVRNRKRKEEAKRRQTKKERQMY